MKSSLKRALLFFDWPLAIVTAFAALPLKLYRRIGSRRLPITTACLRRIGVFPILDHYYEPLFQDNKVSARRRDSRSIPAVDWDIASQLKFISEFRFTSEYNSFAQEQRRLNGPAIFREQNGSFEGCDAHCLFNFIRLIKPRRIVEVGCGESTKLISAAADINSKEGYASFHTCIEPYEQPWLEEFANIDLVRSRVEELDMDVFKSLGEGDLLFIDSSHMIRQQGDVLAEYLEIIPALEPGVYVHVHDIFSPRDYPMKWLSRDVLFWNEQYLLESLLTNRQRYKVILAVNQLKHEAPLHLYDVCAGVAANHEPGSFYFQVRG